jgi:hypothetical protein
MAADEDCGCEVGVDGERNFAVSTDDRCGQNRAVADIWLRFARLGQQVQRYSGTDWRARTHAIIISGLKARN